MNLINILLDKSDLPQNSLSLGGTFGLWDLTRNKIVTMPTYLIYVRQARDKDLKKILSDKIITIQKQIQEVQKFFRDNGFDAPKEPNWERKINDDAPFVVSSTILSDEEIIMALREHLRSTLSLETEALRNATVPKARDLIYSIMQTDNRTYSTVLKLQKEKNWTDDFSPILIQQ